MYNREEYLKRNAIIRYLVNQMNYGEKEGVEGRFIAKYIRNYLFLAEAPLNEILNAINEDVNETSKNKNILFINTALSLIRNEVERYITYQAKKN